MIERALLPFLRGLVVLLERLPQKDIPVSQVQDIPVSQVQDTQPEPPPAKLYVLTGRDREVIEKFLQNRELTDADLDHSPTSVL
jgi:hypothetical protein